MIPAHLTPHTVTRVRPTVGSDADNNTTHDYDSPASSVAVVGRLIQDTAEQRYTEGRATDEEGWKLLTNETDILTIDRITWPDHPRGAVTFEVEGPPMPKYRGGTYHHTRVPLRILNG